MPDPRIRADLIAELHRCANTRRDRQERLIEAIVALNALDRRMAALVDELSLLPQAAQ